MSKITEEVDKIQDCRADLPLCKCARKRPLPKEEESEGWLRAAPIVTAVALALYGYNVSPLERARKMAKYLEGMDVQSVTEILCRSTAYAATELDPTAASVYVCQAMEKYGEEAINRVKANKMF